MNEKDMINDYLSMIKGSQDHRRNRQSGITFRLSTNEKPG